MSLAVLRRSLPGRYEGVEDEALLRLCAQGDCRALEELTRRYQPALFRFACRMLDSREDAEEVVLDVFLRAWRSAPRFQFRARVATWLYRITLNRIRDLHGGHRKRPPTLRLEDCAPELPALPGAERGIEDHMRQRERSDELYLALQRVSAGDCMLLLCYYLEEYSYEEMQTVTGVSGAVLKTRLARARKRLRSRMESARRVAAE